MQTCKLYPKQVARSPPQLLILKQSQIKYKMELVQTKHIIFSMDSFYPWGNKALPCRLSSCLELLFPLCLVNICIKQRKWSMSRQQAKERNKTISKKDIWKENSGFLIRQITQVVHKVCQHFHFNRQALFCFNWITKSSKYSSLAQSL